MQSTHEPPSHLTYCYLISSDIRWVIVFSVKLHSGLMSSHFCWTLASVCLASPKCVILAVTFLIQTLSHFHSLTTFTSSSVN